MGCFGPAFPNIRSLVGKTVIARGHFIEHWGNAEDLAKGKDAIVEVMKKYKADKMRSHFL